MLYRQNSVPIFNNKAELYLLGDWLKKENWAIESTILSIWCLMKLKIFLNLLIKG